MIAGPKVDVADFGRCLHTCEKIGLVCACAEVFMSLARPRASLSHSHPRCTRCLNAYH